MENRYFSLSYKNLKSVPFNKYDNDFTFIVDGRRYPVPRVVADILSPTISKAHFIDESINEFYINTNPNYSEELNHTSTLTNLENYFQDFLNLCTFEEIELDPTRQELFSSYFYKLGNIDEFFRIRPHYFKSLTVDNAVERLQTIYNISEEFDRQTFDVQRVITFISAHFEDIDQRKMNKLPLEILEEIINTENLKITDEDTLFEFILNLYEKDHMYSVLFEYVIFSNLSETSLETFISMFELENINKKIWETICGRLLPSRMKTNERNTRCLHEPTCIVRKESIRQFVQEFKFYSGREFDGIMHFLTDQTGGNIHNNGTIEITTNSIADDNSSFHPKYLVDYQLLTFYESKNEEDIFICFDFKEKSIQLSSYSIKSHKDGFNRGNLRNWIVEVSNDGKNWIEIDRHENDSTLNKSNFTANFVIKRQSESFYRFVRFKQTGFSWYGYPNSNYYYLYFYFVEFFGKIQIPLIDQA